MNKLKKHAFTIVELIAVIIIVGILAALAIPKYITAINKQKGINTINNIRQIIAGEKIYFLSDNNLLPPSGSVQYFDSDLNSNLGISIDENNFYVPSGHYRITNPGDGTLRIETLTLPSWINPRLKIDTLFNISNNTIDWDNNTGANPGGLEYWFDRFPSTLQDDDV